VFILLAAGLDLAQVAQLDWRAAAFVGAVILLARPATVLLALLGTALPWRERAFIALTGPRGVVLVAVAGLFGQRLAEAGVADGARIGPLAFILVLSTVVLHGFTLGPMARRFGLAGTDAPGLLIVGGSRFTTDLAQTLAKADLPVLITDPNHAHLIRPRAAGLRTFYGDVLGEAAEDSIELLSFGTVLAATDNDAYNTLVATDLAPELGREAVWQIARQKEDRPRHALPKQLGGRPFGGGRTLAAFEDLLDQGWRFRLTRLTEEYRLDDWRAKRPGALAILRIDAKGALRFVSDTDTMKAEPGQRILALLPPEAQDAPVVPQPAASDPPAPAPAAPLP
jgi:hypothetical protein